MKYQCTVTWRADFGVRQFCCQKRSDAQVGIASGNFMSERNHDIDSGSDGRIFLRLQ
jgi:hypothetical protein